MCREHINRHYTHVISTTTKKMWKLLNNLIFLFNVTTTNMLLVPNAEHRRPEFKNSQPFVLIYPSPFLALPLFQSYHLSSHDMNKSTRSKIGSRFKAKSGIVLISNRNPGLLKSLPHSPINTDDLFAWNVTENFTHSAP